MFRIVRVFLCCSTLLACGPGGPQDDRGPPHDLYDDGCVTAYNDNWVEFLWTCNGLAQDRLVPKMIAEGWTCEQIYEDVDPHWHRSYDGDEYRDTNWFCARANARFPQAADLRFKWSQSGPVGENCVKVFEDADPHTWDDNYLCVEGKIAKDMFALSKPRWSQSGPIGARCIRWPEPNDEHTWGDNYLCWD